MSFPIYYWLCNANRWVRHTIINVFICAFVATPAAVDTSRWRLPYKQYQCKHKVQLYKCLNAYMNNNMQITNILQIQAYDVRGVSPADTSNGA